MNIAVLYGTERTELVNILHVVKHIRLGKSRAEVTASKVNHLTGVLLDAEELNPDYVMLDRVRVRDFFANLSLIHI